MFGDDDGVDPQFEDVNEYYFEDGKAKPICFSILPFQFGEDDKEVDFFRKDVFLCGFVDKSLRVYKKVVAWKIGLDSEQPNIYVLSIENKWIKLLTPRKCYGEFIRSILITVQMLHFVRKGDGRCLVHLWDHLDEVFGKYKPKPAEGDLMKHRTLIKRFVEKDRTLLKSKILQRLIENGFERTKKALGPEAQFIVSARQHVRNNDGNKDDIGDDSDGSGDDGDDSSDDGDSSGDDGTDQICAICDDGGKLLSCEGPCKRSFHPTEKDGRESKCETLGYTSAEVKRIGTYLCANCKNKQHQCFRCGETNAKVFQCSKASCGYFYHPKCIAELLDPNATDGACELERRIMAGMSFPCPIHWCFKCGRMENKTQRALKLVVCRRCPKAYHRECLPRGISLGTKDKDGNQRAWKLSKTIFIYCLDHEIDKDIGTAKRNHIKFPATPECTKTKELGNSTDRMIGKKRKNTDELTKPTELSNRLCSAESEQAESVGTKKTSPQIDVEPRCAAKRMKGDPQIKQYIVGVAASQNGAEIMKGHKKQSSISSFVASIDTEKRITCLAENGTCFGTPNDGPSTKGMSNCSVQDTPVDKDVEMDNVVCRITDDNYANRREKTQEDYTRKEKPHPKDLCESQGQNDVLELDNLWVEIHTDGSPVESGRDEEWQENACGLGSALGQKKETSRREIPLSDREMIPRNDGKKLITGSGMTADHFDDHSIEKQGNGSSHSKCNDCLEAIDQDTSGDRLKKSSQPVEKAYDGNKMDLDKNKKHNFRDAHNEDRITERNTAADTFKHKYRDKIQSDRREDPVGRKTRSRDHSPERQRMDRTGSYPGSYIRQRCERLDSVNSSKGGYDDCRQWSSCQSIEFRGDQSNSSHLQWRDSQYLTSGRHNSPPYLGRHTHPRRPEYVDHRVDRGPLGDHLYGNFRYGRYAMDNGPDWNGGAYRPYIDASVAEHTAVCYQLHRNELNWRPRASWPVTDKYAPHLERTNQEAKVTYNMTRGLFKPYTTKNLD